MNRQHFLAALFGVALSSSAAYAQNTDATAWLYSTMPSTASHRPEMAFDGDLKTYFQSSYDMSRGDDFTILLSRPIPLRSLRVVTGNSDGEDLLAAGTLEVAPDETNFRVAANFDAKGVAEVDFQGSMVAAIRIRGDARRGAPSLVLREIVLDSPVKISRVQRGPGRGFTDYSKAPDLADWARRGDRQMEEFWDDAEALLYSDGFIPPNKINVIYDSGPNVTPVAATGGGVMTVNIDWCRKQPGDTGLMVHEMAHVVQAYDSYNPGWLVEGIADYVRWVKFEPQNFRVRLDPKKASYRDAYRTTAAFLGWCELHYDSALVRKLSHAVRFGQYSDALFKKHCGKDVDTLWNEFIEAYKANPDTVLTPPLGDADKPRVLPAVAPGSGATVDVAARFNLMGIAKDGERFSGRDGFDSGGAAYSAQLLGTTLNWQNVPFNIGAPGDKNTLVLRGEKLNLKKENYASLWLLGAAVGGSQRNQTLTVTYSDGSTQTFAQHFSDWFNPRNFSGESRALKMNYRNMGNGARDERPFYVYSYGFRLDANKTVQSLTLPNNESVRLLAVTLAK